MLLLDRFHDGPVPGAGWLFLEGMIAATLGCGGALVLFPEETGLVSIFLCAIASLRSVENQLVWNRLQILEKGELPRAVNAIFTGRVLALFAGQLVTFSVLALFADLDLLSTAFTHQMGDFGSVSFPAMSFPPVGAIIGHNLGVLCLFFVLALLFRHGGALLAVAWNASVWGVVFGLLARTWAAEGGPGLLEAYLRVMAGVFPHMALEASGYVLVGFAGVFLSQAIARYESDSHKWDTLLRTVTMMMGAAAASVLLGGLWEGLVTPKLVALLSN